MILTLHIFLILLTLLIALISGLLIRRVLVRRLKNTLLDHWLVQTFGILVIIPFLLLAAAAIPFIITGNFSPITDLLTQVNPKFQLRDFINIGWNFVQGLLILALGIGIARTLMTVTIRGLGEQRIDINIRTFLGRIFFAIIMTLTIFWVLGVWNISVGVPVTVIGALTVAFTFSIQDILKDLVAGFYILLEHPFHIGDQITTANYTGKVEDVQIRATKMRLISGEEVTIPNSLVFGGIVVNNTFYGERRATIIVTLAQDEFVKDETQQQILKIIKGIDTVEAKPEPIITVSSFAGTLNGYTGLVSGYTGKTISLTARFWIASGQFTTVTEVMYALRAGLPNADLAVHESAGDV